jgi:hypothetical protein
MMGPWAKTESAPELWQLNTLLLLVDTLPIGDVEALLEGDNLIFWTGTYARLNNLLNYYDPPEAS